MVSGNEQAKLDPQSPKSGSANLVPDPKTKVGGKQDNKPVQVTVSNEDAMRIFGIKDIKYSNVA